MFVDDGSEMMVFCASSGCGISGYNLLSVTDIYAHYPEITSSVECINTDHSIFMSNTHSEPCEMRFKLKMASL